MKYSYDHPSIHLIEIVAKALGELKDKVVFVGGSTVPFYIEDEGSQEPRPTEDVDCVIEIASYSDYLELENQLKDKGFKYCFEKNAPLCRWKIDGVTVDIMPTDEKIIGFANKWYSEGISMAIIVKLPSNLSIKIFSSPYFIASKIEAFFGRGQGDFRTSHDIEDVVALLDGQLSFNSIDEASEGLKNYLKEKITVFLKKDHFLESISGHLEPGPTHSERVKRIVEFLKKFSLDIK